jgi:hypothetical protein
MVFTVAALMFQLALPAQPLIPASLVQPGGATPAADTSRPKAPVTATADSASSSSETHLNTSAVSLDGSPKGSSAPQLTAISLTEAENSRSLSAIRLPDPPLVKPEKVPAAETRPSTRTWLALSLVQHGAATFDAYTTRQAIGRGAVEMDPLMRPFAHSPAIYGAIQVGPALLDILSRHMQRSDKIIFRRTWWVPQSVSTAGFIFSGVHNMGVAGRQ